MNKFLLVATFGPALHAGAATPVSVPQVQEERASIVVLPTALQRERHVGLTLTMSEGRRLRLGLLSGRAALSDLLPLGAAAPGRALAGMEFDQKLDWGFANIKLGAIRQTRSLLSRQQIDMSPLTQATRTTFTSVSVGYTLAPSLALVGMASFGHTSGIRGASMMSEPAPSSAAAFSIGLSARKLFMAGDSAGLALIAPTKRAGFASVDGTPGMQRGVVLGARYSIDF